MYTIVKTQVQMGSPERTIGIRGSSQAAETEDRDLAGLRHFGRLHHRLRAFSTIYLKAQIINLMPRR